MCRINPEYAQVREIINCEWICSGDSNEVRPYRILIKKCEEEISGERFEEMTQPINLENKKLSFKTDICQI